MISPKENVLKLFHHEIPDYIPKYGEGIINNVPALKKITGRKVVYDVFIDIQWIDAQENAGTLTEEKLRAKIRQEVTEQAAGGAYLPNLYMIHPKWRDIVVDEFEKVRAEF